MELSPIFCLTSFLQKAGLSPSQGLDGMNIFFFLGGGGIYITISFYSYFIDVSLLLIITFLFLRDTDSRKGTMCLFCAPIQEEEEEEEKKKKSSKA